MTQTLSELAAALWPFLNEYLQPRLDAIGASSGSTSADTTTLSTADYPDALLRDGSRSLLGDLDVATNISIDGVDISEFYDSYIAHLTVDAHSIYIEKDSADTITAVHTFSPSSATAPFTLAANAQGQTVTGLKADQLNRTVTAGTGLTDGGALTGNITLNVGAGAGLIGNADDIAVGAGFGITVNADDIELDLDIDPTWTGEHTFNESIHVKHVLPQLPDTYDLGSDVLPFRKTHTSELAATIFAQEEISLVNGWIRLTKDAGTLAAGILTGDVKVDFGKAMAVGDVVEFRGLLVVEYMQVGALDTGTLYNVTRNLDGSGANAWNIGTPFSVLGTTGNGRIDLDGYNTPRISLFRQGATYNSASERIRLGDLNGTHGYSSETYGAVFGEYTSGAGNITIDEANGIRLRSYTTDKIVLSNSGDASIAGSFTIGTSGGIYQGTGTFASPTTGLKLYNSGGVGVLTGYNTGVVQAQFNTSGEIEAAGGLVKLNASGIDIAPTTARSSDRSYKFLRSGNNMGGLSGSIGTNTHSIFLTSEELSGESSNLFLDADANGASREGQAQLRARNVTNSKSATVNLTATTTADAVITADTITLAGRLIHSTHMEIGGTSFPASPANNYVFYRTDRGLLYYYNSATTSWLTVNEYSTTIAETTFAATGGSPMIPLRADYAPYITRIKASLIVATTHDATHRWTLSFRGYNAAHTSATNLNADLNSFTINAAASTWGGHEFAPSVPTPANDENLVFTATKVNSPGNLTMSVTFYYRLIG